MDQELLERLHAEEIEPFEGWDFSHLKGRVHEGQLSWDRTSIVREALPGAASLLDMGNLEHARAQLETASFKVVKAAEEFPITSFTDVGAIVYYLKAIPWQIPDFTVSRYSDRLEELKHRL